MGVCQLVRLEMKIKPFFDFIDACRLCDRLGDCFYCKGQQHVNSALFC